MKKGCIKIQRPTYENSWHIVSKVFEQFKPFHIELRREIDAWVFTGTCDSFDEVAEHEPAPEYLVTVHTADGLHISFQRTEPAQHEGPGLMPLAMQILKDELKKDQAEGSLYDNWKTGLARIIRDRFWWLEQRSIAAGENSAVSAAEIFLNNLINSK